MEEIKVMSDFTNQTSRRFHFSLIHDSIGLFFDKAAELFFPQSSNHD